MRILLSFFLMLILFSPLLRAGVDELAPVPDAQAQVKADNEIQETFKEEFAKAKQGAGKRALANLLLKNALETMDNPVARYVMLRRAHDLAAETGGVALAVWAIDEMARDYDIHPFAMKAELLDKAEKNKLSRTQPSTLAGHALAEAEAAIAADQLDDAERLNKQALRFASAIPPLQAKGQQIRFSKYATNQRIHLQQARESIEIVKPAFELLKEKPDDPEANMIAGKHVCFVKGDWESGLPMLAKGTDAKLRKLANNESTNPMDASEQKYLGDNWWEIAEKKWWEIAKEKPGLGQLNIQQHASRWYESALRSLNGEDHDTVKQRINKLDYYLGNYSAKTAIWDDLDIKQSKVKDNFLRLEKNQELATSLIYSGPIEITILARTQKNNIRLRAYQAARLIFNWEGKPDELRYHWNDGKGGDIGEHTSVLKPDTWYELTWRITDKGMTVLVDGNEILTKSKAQSLINLNGKVRVQAFDSVIDVKSVTIKTLR